MDNHNKYPHLDHEDLADVIKKSEVEADGFYTNHLAKAERNEHYVAGRQNYQIHNGIVEERDYDNLPYFTLNYLKNLVRTWATALNKASPNAVAYPSHLQSGDMASANLANTILEHFWSEKNIETILRQTAEKGATHGTGALKVYFDVETNQVEVTPLSVFDYYVDPKAQSLKDAKWVLFHEYQDKYDAQEILDNAGIDAQVQEEEYTLVDNTTRKGVRRREFWHKPSARFPLGIYASMLGDHVVEAMPYPYLTPKKENWTQQDWDLHASGALEDFDPFLLPDLASKRRQMYEAYFPLVSFNAGQNLQTYFGSTWVSDCIGAQDTINISYAKKIRLAHITSDVKLMVPKSIEGFAPGDQIIRYDDSELGHGIQYVHANISDVDNNQLIEDLRQKLYEIAGVSELNAGAAEFKASASGRAMQVFAELDNNKNAESARQFQDMILDLSKTILNLAQQWYDPEVIGQIAAASGVDVSTFVGADLQGVDVRLERGSALDSSRGAQKAIAGEEYSAGLVSPAEYQERTTTGLTTTSIGEAQRGVVIQELNKFLQGQQPNFNNLEPSLIKTVIAEERLKASPEVQAYLDQIIKYISQSEGQQNAGN